MIIGRKSEIAILKDLLGSDKAELLALYGRRRVGKTFLIQEYYKGHLAFQCSGQYKGKTADQLFNFSHQLDTYFPKRGKQPVPHGWKEAFLQLQNALEQQTTKGRK